MTPIIDTYRKLDSIMMRWNFKATLRWMLLTSIITYLLYNLSKIGWPDILAALPSSPVFYALSIAMFFTPIFAEMAAFKVVTDSKIAISCKVFIRKHVLNKAVLTYSGEAYLAQQLTKTKDINIKRGVIIIKDLALIRTFVANLWVVLLVLFAVILGRSEVIAHVAQSHPAILASAIVISLGISIGAVMFFSKLTNLAYKTGAKTAAIFLLRSTVVAAILVAQWSLAIPETALSVWCLFLVIFAVTRKSPIGGELVFISVALSIPGLTADSAALAAMLMTILALNQINYITAFILTSDFSDVKRGWVKLTARPRKLVTS